MIPTMRTRSWEPSRSMIGRSHPSCSFFAAPKARPGRFGSQISRSSSRPSERKRARAGTHMWTAPGLQGRSRGTDRIDCDHMSGLLLAVHMTACLDGFRDASSKQHSGFNRCHWVPRSVSRLGSIDHTICSVSSKLRLQRKGGRSCAELVTRSSSPTPRQWSVLREGRSAARSPHVAQRRAPPFSRRALRWRGRAWDRSLPR